MVNKIITHKLKIYLNFYFSYIILERNLFKGLNMLFFVIQLLLAVIVINLCKKEKIVLTPSNYTSVSLIIPFVVSVLSFLSFFDLIFLIADILLIFFSVYYYINKAENFIKIFYFKDPVKLFILLIIINIIGGFLVNLVRVNLIPSQALALTAFLLGVLLVAYARFGFIALAAIIAKNKNINKYTATLGILGIFGILIICLIKGKK